MFFSDSTLLVVHQEGDITYKIGRRSSVLLKLPAASQGYGTHAATW